MLYLLWIYCTSGSSLASVWLDGYVMELVLSMDAWQLSKLDEKKEHQHRPQIALETGCIAKEAPTATTTPS